MAGVKKKLEIPPHAPYRPAKLSSELVYAVKAVQCGKADARQQALFFEWLLLEASKYHDMEYRPGGTDGDRDTAFAGGRRFVGHQILRAFNMSEQGIVELKLEEGGVLANGDELPTS